jgi:hypothetical protein
MHYLRLGQRPTLVFVSEIEQRRSGVFVGERQRQLPTFGG